jgi:DNA-binding transcriptional LysR family regulator
MAMELRHLRYFVAVAEEGHITRAAERLGIQQPPLSRQIKAIEQELDVQLFRRKARGVELTDAGHALLDDARAILADLDQAFESTRRTARGEQGRICVGITPSAIFHPLLPHAIRSFRDAFPLVSLTLEEHVSNELMTRLRDEQMDAAFIRTSVTAPEGLVITPLLHEPMMVVLPDGHPLTRGRAAAAISLKQIANEAFIVGEPGTGTYEATIAACRASGFSPRVAQRTPRVTSSLGLVAVGLGIALVPESIQRMHMEGVAYRRLKGAAQSTVRLSVVSRRADPSAVVRQFLSLVKNVARVGVRKGQGVDARVR